MSLKIYHHGALAVLAGLFLAFPAVSFGQTKVAKPTCKRSYVSCVQSKEITDEAGKYQCVQQYARCVDAETKTQNPTTMGGIPIRTTSPSQTQQ